MSVYSFERLLKTSCLIAMKITKRTYCFLFLLTNEVHYQISLLFSKLLIKKSSHEVSTDSLKCGVNSMFCLVLCGSFW